ncbi:MAG TPA: glycosyltransferase family 4 protein, partial [Rhodothermales bacterium]
YRLAHALGDLGHHVDVAHCVDAYHLQHPKAPEIRFAEHPNVTRYELRSPFKWLSPLLTQQTGRPFLKRETIQRLLDENRYDVVHFHNTSLLGPGMMAMEPSHGRVVKMYTTHEHWLICPTHVLWKFNRRPCEKPDCFRCTIMAKRPPQLWRYTGYLAEMSRHVDRFVAPSRFTARMHAERGFTEPVEHLPYFIDRVDDEWQNPAPRPHEAPYFLFVGRLEYIKGLHTLIDAWKNVQNADLLVAGTGTQAADLKARAASNPRIKFLGPLNQKQLGALYHHAVASIVPSITYETFGMISIESFARKTPVIARDLGALAEVIDESGGGYAYRTDNELLAAIHRLASDPDHRRELGERGYKVFVDRWSRDAHLEMYFGYLNDAAVRKYGYVPWEAAAVAG